MNHRQYRSMTSDQLKGRRARLEYAVQNGNGRIAKGTIVTITGKFSGLAFETDKCKHCGIQLFVRKCDPDLLELLPQ